MEFSIKPSDFAYVFSTYLPWASDPMFAPTCECTCGVLVSATRHFLFLQGLRSPFFYRLGQALGRQGVAVTKLQFTAGDLLYWPGAGLRCQTGVGELPAFYESLLSTGAYSDIVLFGDCRPVHQPAIACAKRLGLGVHVFEEGYFRPNWVTLERNGVNGYSDLPNDPNWYRMVASALPARSSYETIGPSMNQRVLHDVVYNTANALNRWLFPHYPSHVTYSIAAEYAAYGKRFARLKYKQKKYATSVAILLANGAIPFFLVALQLRGDAQLRFHSKYASTAHFIRDVLESFAQHAPTNTQLVIKNHPLDPGFTDYGKLIERNATKLGMIDRVVFLESGHLPSLLDHAQGMLTINSTTIGQAMFHRCPTIALGHSIFNMPGLVCQGSLDSFWNQPGTVDSALFRAFQAVVMHTTQINGGLYTKTGIKHAVQSAIPRLLAPQGVLQSLLTPAGISYESPQNGNFEVTSMADVTGSVSMTSVDHVATASATNITHAKADR